MEVVLVSAFYRWESTFSRLNDLVELTHILGKTALRASFSDSQVFPTLLPWVFSSLFSTAPVFISLFPLPVSYPQGETQSEDHSCIKWQSLSHQLWVYISLRCEKCWIVDTKISVYIFVHILNRIKYKNNHFQINFNIFYIYK